MKSPMPWFYLLAAANASLGFADDGVDAYRQGDYMQAAQQMTAPAGNDPVADYYLGRMRLYGYGQPKNDTLAMRHFQQAGERGYLPAIRIMARYALLVQKNPEQALYWFKKAADQNDTRGQMYCAAAYLFGVGVKQNPDVAKRYYILAAKNGDSIAQCTLAQSFLETHQSANKKLGLIWLNKSLAQNNPEAQVTMGELYAKGTLLPQDFTKARELVGLAVAQGYIPALYQMGEIARLANDLPQAKEWFTKAANAHYVQAEMAISALYTQEKSPMYDLNAGFLWMLKAAQNGSHDAQLALSVMYKKGLGTAVDEHIANEWQQIAAQTAKWTPITAQTKAARWLTNGKAMAFTETDYRLHGIFSPWQNAVALKENHYNQPPQMDPLVRANVYQPKFEMVTPNHIPISDYYNALVASMGDVSVDPLVFPRYPVVSVDEAKRPDALQSEAILGDASAQYALAQMYQQGIGVKQNIDEAIKYYQLAAAQQDLRALYSLSVLYLDGRDLPADYKKGLSLLQDAAFKGNAHAQYALGHIYEQGLKEAPGQPIIQPNQEQSRAMYALAAVNNDGLAQYRLAEIMVREKQTSQTLQAMHKRTQMIKELYQGAVANGVEKAALPLAFFNAMDSDKLKQEQAYDVAKKTANEGNLDAALLLGLMYDYGIFVKASPDDAVHWYKQAEVNPIGAFLLGTHLSQGTGISQDLEKGHALLRVSAEAGFSYANLNLAIMQHQRNEAFLPSLDKAYALGNSTAGFLLADYYLSLANNDEQMKQAREIYQHVADLGNKDGQLKLAYLFERGLGGGVDLAAAQKWYAMAADQGQPVAQYLLGHFYQLGGLDKNPDYLEAKKWYGLAQSTYVPAAVALGFIYDTVDDDYDHALAGYQRAASSGDAVGQFNAGLIYENGKGRPVDIKKATDLYLLAAAHGHVQAMVQLAGIYFNTEQDQGEALNWYKKAADSGDRDALYQLGLFSETGVAKTLNYAEAQRYYQQSAEKGNANAKLALARMYQYGLGIAKSPELALVQYKELAHLGNAYAQYQLGTYYYDGDVGTRSPTEGKKWLKEAQSNGSPQATKALQWLATQEKDRSSFIEPAMVATAVHAPSKQSADLMYLDALNSWNRGDESSSRVILSRILVEYPDYLPAKQVYQQLSQGGGFKPLG